MKKVLIVGGSLHYPDGMASADRAMQLALGFQACACDVSILSSRSGERQTECYLSIPILQGALGPWLRENRPDIVFCLSARHEFIRRLVRYKQRFAFTLVFDLVEDPIGKLLHQPKHIGSLRFWYQFPRDFLQSAKLMRAVLRGCDCVAVISRELGKKLEKMGATREQMFYLPIVKHVNEEPACVGKAEYDPMRISYCGSMSPTKDGLRSILKAMKYLAVEFPSLRLHLYGKGYRRDLYLLKLYVRWYRLQNSVLIEGFVPKETLHAFLQRSLLLVTLKKVNRQNRYNFPTKIIDYLSAGRPMILPRIGEIPYYFRHCDNALLCSNRNSAECVRDSIRWVIENQEAANRIGQRGRLLLTRDFNASEYARKLLLHLRRQNG